jgi:hypothetical protein
MSDLPNIVLVHGAWADGSSWSAAIERLHAACYRVTSATVRDYEAGGGCRSAQARAGPSGWPDYRGRPVLRGANHHCAWHRCAERHRTRVHCGLGLDEGESIGGLLAQAPPTPAIQRLDIDEQGFAWLPEDDFLNHFAADVNPRKARVMHAVQQPLHTSAWEDVMGRQPGSRSRLGSS